jgi:cobalt-zinc-cadmium efflux system protein
MEGAPPGLSLKAVKQAVEQIEQVKEMHHIHVWELDENNRALEAHIVIEDELSTKQIGPLKSRIKQLLHDQFHIGHSTLEFELLNEDCARNGGSGNCA